MFTIAHKAVAISKFNLVDICKCAFYMACLYLPNMFKQKCVLQGTQQYTRARTFTSGKYLRVKYVAQLALLLLMNQQYNYATT